MLNAVSASFYMNIVLYPLFLYITFLVYAKVKGQKQDKAIVATWIYNEGKTMFYMIYVTLYYVLY